MLKTHYALGRSQLPAPLITLDTGSIQGNNATYYFWIKARNRSGYNTVSTVTTLAIPDDSSIIISEDNFIQFEYEDWIYFNIYFSNENLFDSSVLLYKQHYYEPDQFNTLTISDVTIDSNYAFTEDVVPNNIYPNAGLSKTVNSLLNLPNVITNNIPNGYRLKVTSTNKVYEYSKVPEYITEGHSENIFIVDSLPANNGIWSVVPSNTYTDLTSNYNKELFEVSPSEYLPAPLPTLSSNVVPVKYSIANTFSSEITTGELALNSYISDKIIGGGNNVNGTFLITVIGYLNLTTFQLTTSGINYVNTAIEYPSIAIELSTPLPANHALVFTVAPKLNSSDVIEYGTFITLYPKLNDYSSIDSVDYWDSPVDTLPDLKALPLSSFKDKQVRYVVSKETYYAYNISSSAVDDGDTVIQPSVVSGTGRWLIANTEVKDGTITPAKLSSSTLTLISQDLETTTVTLAQGAAYSIDLDAITTDYLILNTPTEDGNPTIINLLGTLTNNKTKSIILELRQLTGVVQFHNSIIFPGGTLPVLSGNGKIDLIVLLLTKGSDGILKKRGILVQKDIG